MANKHLFPKNAASTKHGGPSGTERAHAVRPAIPSSTAVAEPPSERQEAVAPAGLAAKPKGKRGTKRGPKTSMVAAALQVMASAKGPMSCKELVETMADRGLWTSHGGKTPGNTLYSAILRLIRRDGKKAVFKKAGRGRFALNPSYPA